MEIGRFKVDNLKQKTFIDFFLTCKWFLGLSSTFMLNLKLESTVHTAFSQ